MRLIDADKLIEILSKNSIFRTVTNAEDKSVIEIIKQQPTAFDVDKVVEQLKKQVYEIDDSLSLSARDVIDEEDVFEIVKAGGIDGTNIN